jgi:chromosome partitioning protein
MKTITMASSKGGSGKTTITAGLAVRTCQDTAKVAMMDLNFDQGSLTQWWEMRGEPKAPFLALNVDNIPRTVKALASAYDWLFIDTPPADMDLIEQAIAVADAVVIPVKPGFFDVMAVQSVIEMCNERRKPFSFALNAVDSKFKVLTVQTVGLLNELGPIFATRISYRLQYVTAVAIGKTGPEIAKDLKPEVDALWSEVKRLAEKGRVQ